MQHVMPHERPTAEELGPILEQRYALPAVAGAIALALIVLGGWMELRAATTAIHIVEAHQAAAVPAAPR